MVVDLVRATAADGLRLDGAFLAPAEGTPPGAFPKVGSSQNAALDAVICLHGVTSNFYSSTILESLSTALVPRGTAMLWANTRGHDGLFFASAGGRRRRFGSAYELVDECRHDVAGWIEFLTGRGYERIGLLGHSLGAIKAVYAAAHQPHPAVCGVVAISPARLSHGAFKNSAESSVYFEALTAAEEQVHSGRPEALLEVRFPFPMLITAAGYLDKYGPAERYNILRFANRVAVPTLFVFGERELKDGGVAFAGVPEALRALPQEGQQFTIATVPDADHIYTGVGADLARVVAEWVDNRFV